MQKESCWYAPGGVVDLAALSPHRCDRSFFDRLEAARTEHLSFPAESPTQRSLCLFLGDVQCRRPMVSRAAWSTGSGHSSFSTVVLSGIRCWIHFYSRHRDACDGLVCDRSTQECGCYHMECFHSLHRSTQALWLFFPPVTPRTKALQICCHLSCGIALPQIAPACCARWFTAKAINSSMPAREQLQSIRLRKITANFGMRRTVKLSFMSGWPVALTSKKAPWRAEHCAKVVLKSYGFLLAAHRPWFQTPPLWSWTSQSLELKKCVPSVSDKSFAPGHSTGLETQMI